MRTRRVELATAAAALAIALGSTPVSTRRPMPEIRALPPDALPNPPIDPEAEAERHAAKMREIEERQRVTEVRAAARFAMDRNPYPNHRQGRRRWARELAKFASPMATR